MAELTTLGFSKFLERIPNDVQEIVKIINAKNLGQTMMGLLAGRCRKRIQPLSEVERFQSPEILANMGIIQK